MSPCPTPFTDSGSAAIGATGGTEGWDPPEEVRLRWGVQKGLCRLQRVEERSACRGEGA